MNASWLGLSGTVCAVSGGAGGIGRAICMELAMAGAKIVILDKVGPASQEVATAILRAGGEAIAVETDITSEISVGNARDAAEKAFGAVTVLVNNAALIKAATLLELSVDTWMEVLSVNLTGYFISSQVFGRRMIEVGGGSIIHISSLSGKMPQPYSGAYSISKAGVNMLSAGLAVEWGEYRVRSNVVAPAMVITPMTEMMYANPEIRAKRESVVPSRRVGEPQDIANAVAFIASDRADYINGQELYVDGGWSRNMLALVPRPGLDQTAADIR